MNKQLTLKEIQNEEIKMLKEITKFLEKNNIKYTISDGTMLGAVRHKGFIPWDDDMDISVERKDYDKLIKIFEKNKNITKDLYAVSCSLNTSPCLFIKIFNKKIGVLEKDQIYNNLWVDIFPLDKVPKKNKFFFARYKFWRELCALKMEVTYKIQTTTYNKIKKVFKKIVLFVLRFVSLKFIQKRYLKTCSKYSYKTGDFYYSDLVATEGRITMFPSNLLDEYSEYEFDGEKFIGFKDYDTYLKNVYGDYMTLPKEEDRRTHSFVAWKKDE